METRFDRPGRPRVTTRLARAVAGALVLALVVSCADTDDGADEPGPTAGASEEVVIPADGLDLVGTLYLPTGDGPHPTIVLVHGSGPMSRDGLISGQLGMTLPEPVPVYRELAAGLRDRGFAVFTWDKRTCGPFNGCADNDYPEPAEDLTFDTLRDDAAAVLDAIAERPDVADLAVIGHSKGGTVVAGLLEGQDDLAAAVLLASPAVPVTDVVDEQAEKFAELVVAAGQEGGAADDAIAELQEMADDVARVADGEIDGPPIGGASREFWASYHRASVEAPEQVAAAAIPVLALGGGRDWNVPPEQVLAWEPYLGDDDAVEILPDITHALTYLGTDDVAEINARTLGEEVDRSVIEALASWLDDALDR